MFPQSLVIVCQFHIIQAIIRFDGDKGRVSGGPKIPYLLKYQLLIYFQEAQRCRVPEQWEMYEARFFQQLERLCMFGDSDSTENTEEAYESDDASSTAPEGLSSGPSEEVRKARYVFLHDYFKNNFFSHVWLRES